MARKNASKYRNAPKAEDLFQAAIRKADLDKVRELLAAGHKPDASAAREAVDECVRLAGTAGMKKRPLFGRMPTNKEKQKAAAAADIYYQIAEALLEAGVPTPELLCSAARCGHTQLALLLIRHGADVDYDPPMGTPLENTVQVGNLEVVRALIKAGADIHHQGIKGTLLNRAVEKNHLEVAKELIKVGLDVNAQPKLGSTALLMAVTERKSEFVRLLLDAGADVNQKGTVVCGDFGEPQTEGDGNFFVTTIRNPPVARDAPPIIVATRRGYADIAAQLIAAGADVNAIDAEGFTAFVYATKAGDEALLRLLQDAGAKAPKYPEGSTEAAWMAAAKAGDCDRLSTLIKDGVDVNLKHSAADELEETALKCAAENGHLDAVELLLQAGARADEKFGDGFDIDHETALMHAAKAGHVELAKALIHAGAAAMAKSRSGKTVLHYAAERGHAAMIDLLVRAGAKVETKTKYGDSPLMLAAGEGHAEAVKALLNAGADLNRFTGGMTALCYAALGGHVAAVKALLAGNADPKGANPSFSPLEGASSGGHKEIVDLLLKAGAGRKKRGGRGPVCDDPGALANAALMGQVEIVRTLLESGADPSRPSEEHFTPLMGAVRALSLEIVEMLLKAGTEVNALNEDRETALDLAYDNIKSLKDQAKFIQMISGDEMDDETREAVRAVKSIGKEDEIVTALKRAGGKRAKELKGKRAPRPAEDKRKPEKKMVEVALPDFTQRARTLEFQKAIEELSEITGKRAKPSSNEDGNSLKGCVTFQLPTKTADKVISDHHQAFLIRGCYLLKSRRGYTSGKDELTLLPTTKRAEVLAAFQTNGANSDIYTHDIIQWLDELEKTQPFLLTGAGFDWCEGKFTKPLVDSKKLAKQMYEFCPDIVGQGTGDVARLALELKKTQRFFFWWD